MASGVAPPGIAGPAASFSQSFSEILLPFSQVRTDRAGEQLNVLNTLQELSALSARGHVTPAATLLHTCASFTATLSLAAAADKSGPQHTSEREEGRREGKINRFQSAFFQSRLQTAREHGVLRHAAAWF